MSSIPYIERKLPSFIEEPPEGYVYLGQAPLRVRHAVRVHMDLISTNTTNNVPMTGIPKTRWLMDVDYIFRGTGRDHYALREGSEPARRNGIQRLEQEHSIPVTHEF